MAMMTYVELFKKLETCYLIKQTELTYSPERGEFKFEVIDLNGCSHQVIFPKTWDDIYQRCWNYAVYVMENYPAQMKEVKWDGKLNFLTVPLKWDDYELNFPTTPLKWDDHELNFPTEPKALTPEKEDDEMGFGHKQMKVDWPAQIKDADLSLMAHVTMRSIINIAQPGALVHAKGDKRINQLREIINTQYHKAQVAYAQILLNKTQQNVGTIREEVEKLVHDSVAAHVDEMKDDVITASKKEVSTLAAQAVKEAAQRYRPIAIVDRGKVRKVKGVLPPEFDRMVQLASARIPILLVGPAGCGKTYLCEKLAEALGLEFSDQSCSEGMSESVFNGLLLPIGKQGAFDHVSSPFMDRYESGGVMLLDELDAGDPNLFTYINKAVANSSYTVAQRFNRPVVKKHADFVLVAAANTFGNGADAMYVGRNQLDAATLDRFKVGLIQMDYSREVERSLADEDLCAWAWKIRKKIYDSKLRRVMSTRVIKDLSAMTMMYKWKQPEWENAYFAGWSEQDRRAVNGA